MTKNKERIRNPFRELLTTELLEDPVLYRRMFSESILVGESLQVFRPVNVVLLGQQGAGKSMILNLALYHVISAWISKNNKPPTPLDHIEPFFGISINLARVGFHIFGRRSISKGTLFDFSDSGRDPAAAADFLNHFLFYEFLNGIRFLLSDEGVSLRDWMGVSSKQLVDRSLVERMSSWESWYDYYSDCHSLDSLMTKCKERLSVWRRFLNTNLTEVPSDILETQSEIGLPLHEMGKLIDSIGPKNRRLPLFVVVDQYEALPELNLTHGTKLQRVVNTLIKARDPYVFYKLGARTYDWGTELRVWGAESRIEVQRDYVIINLTDVLMRREDSSGWVFPELARDVAYKRMLKEGYRGEKNKIKDMLGPWFPNREAALYFNEEKDNSRKWILLRGLADTLRIRVRELCGDEASPIDIRLAGAWLLQRLQKGVAVPTLVKELEDFPWRKRWWKKERVEVALLQIASYDNQKRIYFGWDTVIYLSGGNITAFLLLCSEIWDAAAKRDVDPLRALPLEAGIQSNGINRASETWSLRDRNEISAGRKRYEVITRLGPSIHDSLIGDAAISNPGHTGFSIRESDLLKGDEKSAAVEQLISKAVSYAMFEERSHHPKVREGTKRRKWYLHPLLSPQFQIPHKRVKEPFYVQLDVVYDWFFGQKRIDFGPRHKHRDVPNTVQTPKRKRKLTSK